MVAIILIILLAVIFYSGSKKDKPISLSEKEETYVNDVLLEDNVMFYKKLTKPDRLRFEQEVKEFLAEVKITGIDVKVSNLDRVLVACSAIIPVFNFPGSKYPNLREVLLYSDAINMQFESQGNNDRDILGMVGTGSLEGKLLLSQPALELGFSNKTDKRNTAIHEFVHLIDKSDGDTDGVPELLMDKQYTIPWLDLIHKEMKKIASGDSDIDPYGYTNQSEFFAVAAEYFFERPELFREKHPQLYSMMKKMFTPEQQ
jgi:MtfA peptidase